MEEENKNIADIDTISNESIENNNYLSLNKYFELCLNFEDNPTSENELAIKTFLSQLQIKDFLSLKQKTIVAITITKDLIDELDSSGAASTLEIGKLFHGLLSYVINIKDDIGMLNRTFIAYDYCYMYGLADTILNICSKDYQRLCSYIDNMINISNAYRLIQTASVLNDTEYNKWINTMKDLKEQITPEMLKSLLAVDVMNNGGNDLQNILGEMAAKEVEEGLRHDEVKYTKISEDLDRKLNHVKDINPNNEEK